MKNKIIKAIAEYLEQKTIWVFNYDDSLREIYANWPCEQSVIAKEIADAISPHMEESDFPFSKLFDHMSNEHGLTLTNTELGDIINIARGK
jgi:hypothetical protein